MVLVDKRFWGDDRIRALPVEGKLLMMYLLTGPQSDRTGLFRMFPDGAMCDTGLSREGFEVAMARLVESGMVRWDPAGMMVWIVNRIRYSFTGKVSELHARGIVRVLDDLPGSPLKEQFLAHYRDFLAGLPGKAGEGLLDRSGGQLRLEAVDSSGPGMGSPRDSEAFVKGLPRVPTETETETETATETGTETEKAGERGSGGEGAVIKGLVGFEQFWSAYPQKVGKTKAEEAWRTHTRGVRLEDVLAGIERWRGSQKWQEGFIPLPTTWLNQGRWRDTPGQASPLSRAGAATLAAGERLIEKLKGGEKK
jgi:hypothetical protein